jgi:ubiquinone/menaquinone biosynthesis C-methylase UbiE
MKIRMNCLRDNFKQVLFELGAGYYSRKIATGPEAELRNRFVDWMNLTPAAQGSPGRDVLDVGCGPGHVTRAFARRGHSVTGVDRCRSLLRIARRSASREELSIRFEHSPVEKLPFPDASFDCAFTTGVIYWVEKPLETLREMVRVLRPGGMIASLDPHASMSLGRVQKYSQSNRLPRRDARKLVTWAMAAGMNRKFEERELRALFTRAGITNLTLERQLSGMVWFSRGIVPHHPR